MPCGTWRGIRHYQSATRLLTRGGFFERGIMKRITPLLLAALVALPVAAQAGEPDKLPVNVSFLSKVQVAPSQDADAADGWGKTADTAALGELRGGADTVFTEASATLSGTVGHNVANNVTTGFNVIDNGSFSGASGLPVVIQNSGANVLIQNATVINLQLQ